MDLAKIKNLIRQTGEKFIVLENGEPELVIMPFSEYMKLAGRSSNMRVNPTTLPMGMIEETKVEIGEAVLESPSENSRRFIPSVVNESIGLPVRLEDIRLEDLPI